MKHGWKRYSSSSVLFLELHWYIPHFTLSSRQTCSFSLQNEIVPLTNKHYKILQGKSPLFLSTFQYLNYNYWVFCFPDAWSFSFSNASHSFLLSLCDHEPTWWLIRSSNLPIHCFGFHLFSAIDLLDDSPGFSYASSKRFGFLHATVVSPLSRTSLQSIDKYHLLERRYKKTSDSNNWMTMPQGNGLVHLRFWAEKRLSLGR